MRSTHLGGAAAAVAAAGWWRRIAAAAILGLAAAAAALLLTSVSTAAPRRRESLYFFAPSAAAIDRPLVDTNPTEALSDANSSAPSPPTPPAAEAAAEAVAPAPAPSESFDDVVEESSTGRDVDAPPLVLQADSRGPAPFIPSNAEPIANTSPVGDSEVGEVEPSSIEQKVAPLQPEISTWLTPTDQELIYAKREVERAPPMLDDPDLYALCSGMCRSYELMERILKVYIYQDGDKPIFHTPELKGIYASEGWFMKLLQGNKQFVVKDPTKAHLFYLPYSSRQLEHALYVPNSHTIIPLSIFLKNYVNMIATKYPFWNRTKGADHFFVACHDWGPYTTKLHDELRKNTIKALCNADVSEDVFVRGKDVSLPETYIKIPKNLFEMSGVNRFLRDQFLPSLLDKCTAVYDPSFSIIGVAKMKISEFTARCLVESQERCLMSNT
uniref:Exostosin GT47 domain-containing protein n=1 Tax=Ananas comosus var. bracteatus TaxID=296719 RepID=A0A6V7QI48_ANACO|nr:unnamed protein product [Ananas comosus var. bracteatus]